MRCTRGAIHDVAVDLRPASPSYLRWVGVELSADNGRALYVPEGCAHGFQSLVDATEVLYQISTPYVPESRAACAGTTRPSVSSGRRHPRKGARCPRATPSTPTSLREPHAGHRCDRVHRPAGRCRALRGAGHEVHAVTTRGTRRQALT